MSYSGEEWAFYRTKDSQKRRPKKKSKLPKPTVTRPIFNAITLVSTRIFRKHTGNIYVSLIWNWRRSLICWLCVPIKLKTKFTEGHKLVICSSGGSTISFGASCHLLLAYNSFTSKFNYDLFACPGWIVVQTKLLYQLWVYVQQLIQVSCITLKSLESSPLHRQ